MAREALLAAKWRKYEDESNTWECSNCGGVWQLNEGSPDENGMKYCPFCGLRIVEVRA